MLTFKQNVTQLADDVEMKTNDIIRNIYKSQAYKYLLPNRQLAWLINYPSLAAVVEDNFIKFQDVAEVNDVIGDEEQDADQEE